MSLMKFEVEIPEFEKELSINIIIKKDGEVVSATSSSKIIKEEIGENKKEEVVEKELPTKTSIPKKKEKANTSASASKGNLMNLDF
jgi:hypothetical protein